MKTITLSGFVWITIEDRGRSILMLGSHKRDEAKAYDGLITHAIYIDPATELSLLEPETRLVVTASYEAREGMLPILTATAIDPFDGRETDDWRTFY